MVAVEWRERGGVEMTGCKEGEIMRNGVEGLNLDQATNIAYGRGHKWRRMGTPITTCIKQEIEEHSGYLGAKR